MLAITGGRKKERLRRYAEFVETGLAEDDDEFREALRESPRSIGSDGFRMRVDGLYQQLVQKQMSPEDASFRHVTEPLPVSTILDTLSEVFDVEVAAFTQRRRKSPLRAVASQMLVWFGGLTQRQVASHLGMGTGGSVSAQLRRLPGLLAADLQLRRWVLRLETAFLEMGKARNKTD